MRRQDLLPRLGIEPPIAHRMRVVLSEAIRAAGDTAPGTVRVLDAGCGRKSPLARFRPLIDHLVAVDIHEPAAPLPWIDEFAVVDLCRRGAWTPRDPFDLILSNFTIEHFHEPGV